jgi:hypothetical protein
MHLIYMVDKPEYLFWNDCKLRSALRLRRVSAWSAVTAVTQKHVSSRWVILHAHRQVAFCSDLDSDNAGRARPARIVYSCGRHQYSHRSHQGGPGRLALSAAVVVTDAVLAVIRAGEAAVLSRLS